MATLLQIALNSHSKIVSIYEVPTGIKCGCTCPECGEILEAKNRGKSENMVLGENQKTAHFAHVSGKLCKYAGETALHKLAKEVISETKTLLLPELSEWGVNLAHPVQLKFDKVELEKTIVVDGVKIVPDAILTLKGSRIFLEFYKTHIVDENKRQKINKIGVSTIEVDLNTIEPLKDGVPNREEIREFLENDTLFKEWLFNAKRDVMRAKAIDRSKVKLEEQEKVDYQKARIQEQNWKFEQDTRKQRIQSRAAKIHAIENWKDNALAKGYQLLKTYSYGRTVYCPKERKVENRKDADDCYFCQHYFNIYTPSYDDKRILCGFKANLTSKKI